MLFKKKKPSLGFISSSAPKCLACPLNNKRRYQKLKVYGEGEHKILLIFNCPSEVESSTGRTGVGSQYFPVKEMLEEIGLSFSEDCWKIHAVNCYYKTTSNPDKMIDCCAPYVESTIKELKPKLIIAFGGEASKAVLKNRFSDCSAGRWRGIPLFVPEYNAHLMVTYDPAKFDHGMDGETYYEVTQRDVQAAIQLLKQPPPVQEEPFVEKITDYKELVSRLKYIRDNAELLVLDYETTGLKPNNAVHRIAANAITYTVGDEFFNVSYPISYKGWFTEKQEARVKELTAEILQTETPKVGHHLKFEEIWGHKILGVPTKNWIWCTMYCAHIIDERPKHCSLKTQAFIYFQSPPYEEELKKYLHSAGGGNEVNTVDKAPLLQLLQYNGLDTYYTYKLYLKQKEMIANNPSLYFINDLFLQGALLFSDMEKAGFGIVPGYFEEKDEELTRLIKESKKIILGTEEALKYKKKFKRPFSLNSDDDVYRMIYKVIDVEVSKRTKKGKGSTDAEILMALEKQGSEWAKHYIEHTRLCKTQDTFVSGILKEVDEHNKLHPFYHLFTTRTGRSCIAKGTMIEVVRDLSKNPEGVPIEDVKPGDYVYCYDDNCNLTIKKVLWSGKTGTKEVVKVFWKSHGGKARGHVKMTPDHRIRMINGEYVEAEKINLKGDYRIKGSLRSPKVRALALLRTTDLEKLYVTGRNEEPIIDHRFVYENLVGNLEDSDVIHHKDFNHKNNVPHNLLRMSKNCHHSLHGQYMTEEQGVKKLQALKKAQQKAKLIPKKKGEENPNFIRFTRIGLVRAFFRAGGQLTRMPFDFQTIKDKFQYYNLGLELLRERFSRRGFYITRGMMIRCAHFPIHKIAKTLGIGHPKVRALYDSRGIKLKSPGKGHVFNNHIIYRIERTKEVCDVYDLEVEECHNFIAGGICVHNSSTSPNWQTVPKRNKFVKTLIRSGVVAPLKNHRLCEADYGSLEVRIAACYTKDPVLIRYINDPTTDMHRDTAVQLFFVPPDLVSSVVRFYAKNGFVFANFYGASPKSCAKTLWKIIPELFDKDERPVFEYLQDNDIYSYQDFEAHVVDVAEKFWKKFKVFRKWQYNTIEEYHERGFIQNKFGFMRRGLIGRNEIINTNIQGSAFQCLLWSGIQVNNKLKAEAFKSKVIGQIHDSLITSIHPKEFDDVTHIIKYTMEDKLRKQFPWVIVPMIAEFEASDPGGSWNDLKVVDVKLPRKYRGY